MWKKFAALLFISFSMLIVGCGTKNRERCPIGDLLLDKGLFPEGSTEDQMVSPIPEEPKRSAGRYVYFGGTAAYHEVIVYPSEKRAEIRYAQMKKAGFREEYGPWEITSITFISKVADEMSYGCGKSGNRNVCIFIGRYKTLVTFLSMDIDSNSFSKINFEQAIAHIEEKILSCNN